MVLISIIIIIIIVLIILILYINNSSSKSGLLHDRTLFPLMPYEDQAYIIYNAENGIFNSPDDEQSLREYRKICASSTDCMAALDRMETMHSKASKYNVQ